MRVMVLRQCEGVPYALNGAPGFSIEGGEPAPIDCACAAPAPSTLAAAATAAPAATAPAPLVRNSRRCSNPFPATTSGTSSPAATCGLRFLLFRFAIVTSEPRARFHR